MLSTLIEQKSKKIDSLQDCWVLVIYNNDNIEFNEVIQVLMQATSCDIHEAYIESWEAHHHGKARVHFALQEECVRAARIISAVGIQTEVSREWSD